MFDNNTRSPDHNGAIQNGIFKNNNNERYITKFKIPVQFFKLYNIFKALTW